MRETQFDDLNHTDEERAALDRANAVASWLDDKIKVLGFGIGLDGLIGLVPVAGDVFAAIMGLFHLNLARKLNLGLSVQFALVFNLLLDLVLGAVPVLGDLFDFAFRSHRRNLKVIEKALQKRTSD